MATRQETLDKQQLEFLDSLGSESGSLVAQLVLSSGRIAAPALGNFDLEDPTDIRALLDALDDAVEEERPSMLQALEQATSTFIGLATAHVTDLAVNKGIDPIQFMGQTAERTQAFLNTPMGDGLTLSERLWSPSDKVAIQDAVANAIADGKSVGELAQDIKNTVTTGTPRSSIDRISNTELTKAYNRTKTTIAREIQDEFPEFEPVVKVSLSPFHPRADICDILVGTYKVGEAPIPPHHPNCICSAEIDFKKAGSRTRTTTLAKQIAGGTDFLDQEKVNVKSALSLIEFG